MGNDSSVISIPTPRKDQEQTLHVRLLKYTILDISPIWLPGVVVFEFSVGFQRYSWNIFKRYKEVYDLYSYMLDEFPLIVKSIPFPRRHFKFWERLDEPAIMTRGVGISNFLEKIALFPEIMESVVFWEFLEVSRKCFAPELGRKGKAGYLKKVFIVSKDDLNLKTFNSLQAVMRFSQDWICSSRGIGDGLQLTTLTSAITCLNTLLSLLE